jgi:nicotinate-nucleotide pyrophosphorylase (carboxylating)
MQILSLDTSIESLITLALEEDLGKRGDVTTQAIVPPDQIVTGRITAKAPGIIAGLAIVEAVYRHIDPAVTMRVQVRDGARVVAGSAICDVTGAGRSILTGERIALNFLQHLSGIATLTARFVYAVRGTGTVILDTRKTTPGWRLLEKYAVLMGGGQNHRLGLYDMVLIKDNHIAAAGSITAAVKAVRSSGAVEGLAIEVEVTTYDELREALALGVDRILLDNMKDDQIRNAVMIADGRVPLEAAGNMTLERATKLSAFGIDFISVGALTHSAPALDLSMGLTLPDIR